MKTTLNIDDTVMTRLRREAARTGRTMSALVDMALRQMLEAKPEVKLAPLPSFRGGAYLVDVADRDALYRAMEEEDWMFVVDTNVLLYAANDDAPEHAHCRRLLEGWRRQRGAWFLTWGISYEFLRVVTHPRGLARPWNAKDACRFLAALHASPGLTMLVHTDAHRELLDGIVAGVPRLAGNIMHDVTTAVLMKEHGIRTIYTRDTDFHRFPFLEVVDPLTIE